jgi:hypothetical protein
VGFTNVFAWARWAFLPAVFLASCSSIGPQSLSSTRPLYNEAVQQTDSQQLLLNIVRQRYNDPVLFLDVTNISSATRFIRNANVSAVLPDTRNNIFNSGVGATFEDFPTIFYTPNVGEKFVRQMLTPLDLRTITLMLQSGWSVERTLLVAGDALGPLRNTLGSPAQQQMSAPDYTTVADALRKLQRSGDLTIGVDKSRPDAQNIVITFTPSALTSESYKLICSGVKVMCNGAPISLTQGIGVGADNTVALATRSLYSAFFYLSQGVDVPDTDLARGAVNPVRDINGQIFDWATARAELFRVRSSTSEPQDVHVKVFYRGHWFYIPDTDIDSRTTFSLVSMLLTLQAGSTERAVPLITLPAR